MIAELMTAATTLPVAGLAVVYHRRPRHEAARTEWFIDTLGEGDRCLHEVCTCGAARPCGDKRWSSRFCRI
jgi:hypothetical protein